jgi:hypothetical protein
VGADAELAPIAMICGGPVQRMEEGGRHYIYMGGLHFLVKGQERVMDALLCLDHPNDSYPTKLFFPANLGLGLNWNENAFILARPWFSWSWSGIARNQPPFAILAEHLSAFR